MVPRNFSSTANSTFYDVLAVSEKIFAIDIEAENTLLYSSTGVGRVVTPNISIATAFKDTLACQGSIRTHQCSIRETLVDYAVMIKNDTITLQHPHWQSDIVHESDVSNGSVLDWGVFTNQWGKLFALLSSPIRINVTQENGTPMFTQHLPCQLLSVDYMYAEMSGDNSRPKDCPIIMPMIRDLSRTYSNQPLSYQHACNYTWRDPMQVSSLWTSFHYLLTY